MRGLIPTETLIHDPETLILEVIEETHYMPEIWKDVLHTIYVRKQFDQFFQYRIVIFFKELLGILTAPIVLWYSLPKSSEKIIDYFQEFTTYEESIGYLCSFALFDFKKHGDINVSFSN
jgi:autophagy-related protein 9